MRSGSLGVLLLAIGLSLPGMARAQTTTTPPTGWEAVLSGLGGGESAPATVGAGVVPGAVDPLTYVVGPGDVLQLTLSGPVSRSFDLTVGPEGDVVVPGSGPVRVDGIVLADARERILRAAMRQLRGGVRAGVRLLRVRTLRVEVLGEVRRAGPLDLPATSRVSDALPESTFATNGSRRNIVVRHVDGSNGIADVGLYRLTGESSMNPYLRDGDRLVVNSVMRFMAGAGALARPGTFELGPNDSLHTLIEVCGGSLPSARRDSCLLLRWISSTQVESVSFSLDDVIARRFDPPLRDGDRAYLYFVPAFHELDQATILGEIGRPGSYPLERNRTRLSDLVRSAGGFRPDADLSTIRVYRATRLAKEYDPELDRLMRQARTEMTESEYEVLRARLASRREDFRVDWNRLVTSSDLDPLLDQGDVVRVDPILSSVRVEGEVRRPGLVQFRAGLRVSDYVQLAGGYSRRAAKGKVRITRSVTGQTIQARDVGEIAPGDMLWVPERPDVTTWQNLQTLITVAAQVATVIIAVRR